MDSHCRDRAAVMDTLARDAACRNEITRTLVSTNRASPNIAAVDLVPAPSGPASDPYGD